MRTKVQNGLESDLQELTSAIQDLDTEAAAKQDAADELVEKLKGEGTNPLLDAEAFEQVDAAYKASDELKEKASTLRQRRESVMGRLGDSQPAKRKREASDLVERFMSTPEFQRLAENDAFASPTTRIDIPGIEILSAELAVKGLKSGRGLFAATADIDDFVPIDQRLFPPVDIPVRKVRVTQMVTVTTTESDQVDFVRETTRTDAAAETAPGTAAPEATYVYTAASAPVRDIVHFTPAHKRNLADAGETRGLLEGRLESGVERRLESSVVSGDGSGQNLEGILHVSTIGSIEEGEAGHTDENILDAIHRGITTVRIALEDDPDALGLHPTPYDQLVTTKAEDSGVYLLGDAAQRTSQTIWGFPVAVTTAFPDDRVLVGNYKQGATLYLRSGVALSASDSHEDFFTRRMVALMAELRAAFAVGQPRAFCEVVLAGS